MRVIHHGHARSSHGARKNRDPQPPRRKCLRIGGVADGSPENGNARSSDGPSSDEFAIFSKTKAIFYCNEHLKSPRTLSLGAH